MAYTFAKNKTIKIAVAAGSIFFLIIPCIHPLTLVCVQFEVKETLYSSVESFKSAVTDIVEEQILKHDPDLIVFPEYTSVFTALIPYWETIDQSSDMTAALDRIKETETGISGLKDIFIKQSGFVDVVIKQVFGELARNHSVYILGGSHFTQDTDHLNETVLKNRAFIFNREGDLYYTQDKVYLTAFEEKVVGLSPGELSDVRTFSINGKNVALTICRDTFMPVWENYFLGSDLWLDIKANGTAYTQEQQRSFMRALPSRIKACDVPYGATVCLTGFFLDLFWEGESSIVKKAADEIIVEKKASSPNYQDVISIDL